MSRRRLAPLFALAALLAGCDASLTVDRGLDATPGDAGAPAADASSPGDADLGDDTGAPPDGPDASVPAAPGVAPGGAVPGAVPAKDGPQQLVLEEGSPTVLEVVARPGEHVGFFLWFEDTLADVVMYVDRWDGLGPQQLGLTDAGRGVRTLAVFEPAGERTHWVRLETTEPSLAVTLEVVRTPFEDDAVCTDDCAHLLQLPLPVDPTVDGYDWTPSTVMRYWFGRRDMLMMLRYAGQDVAARGFAPFLPEDLSQWDGETPGVDVGSPRHASHQRGKDVDLSLYETDGGAPWRSYCTIERTADGRECIAGTADGLDGRRNAIAYAGFLQTRRVTMSFLDQELIPVVVAGAAAAEAAGEVDPALVPLYSDGRHLQHWPNHDNHIHVRISEDPYDAAARWAPFGEAPFEAP